MKISAEQRAEFDRNGYLFFPGLFSREETKVLTDAVPELYARRELYNVREKDSDAVRTNFAAHLYSVPFAKLARHPRMVEPVRDLFDELTMLAEKELKRSGEFQLPGMVKLVLQKRKARTGRNPATGEEINIPAKTVVKARIVKQMKDAVLPKKA